MYVVWHLQARSCHILCKHRLELNETELARNSSRCYRLPMPPKAKQSTTFTTQQTLVLCVIVFFTMSDQLASALVIDSRPDHLSAPSFHQNTWELIAHKCRYNAEETYDETYICACACVSCVSCVCQCLSPQKHFRSDCDTGKNLPQRAVRSLASEGPVACPRMRSNTADSRQQTARRSTICAGTMKARCPLVFKGKL